MVADAVPADYEARVRPEAAVGDLVNVEAMLSGTDDITTSFGRSLDAVDGEWRFRVFLRDRPTTIAELVPMLEHLGLSPVDEHPSVFVGDVGHGASRRHRGPHVVGDDHRCTARRGPAGVRRADDR